MSVNEINIKWPELFKKINGLKTECSNRLIIEREVIPVIFVPGIMGSRLINADGKKIWDPDDSRFMIGTYDKDVCSPFNRKSLIVGDAFSSSYLEVDNKNGEHNKKFHDTADTWRDRRGWGGVFWKSYGDIITSLQRKNWVDPVGNCFEFPVYAFGYNWTRSNRDSGKELKDYIDKITGYFRDEKKRMCKYAILITHSMGGIVARSACEQHGAEKNVLGVIHGAQPAQGAPAAYWRMKAGFERPNLSPWDWLLHPIRTISARHAPGILGSAGEDVACILGNIPGGLELLPNKNYRSGRGWLKCPCADGSVKSLPASDPYTEIYKIKEDVYYRMVDPEWLDPRPAEKDIASGDPLALQYMKSFKEKRPGVAGQFVRDGNDSSWGVYEAKIDKAAEFHDDLGDKLHPTSYNIYISGLNATADGIEFRLETVGKGMNDRLQPDRDGGFSEYVTADLKPTAPGLGQFRARLQKPSGMGDGTVPNSSASALKIDPKRTWNIERGSLLFYNHQELYNTPEAKEAVFVAIENLAKIRIDEEVPG
jgi:hypothetical protein